MRDTLKNFFSNQITLEDKSEFYYTVKPYELINTLGSIVTVLQEYSFTKKGDETGQFSCKLYRTKEGNWYDMPEDNISSSNPVVRALKLAVENQNITI